MSAVANTALCATLLFGSIVFGVFGISINNGRYEDINIVIQDNVPENALLLERIKEVFTDTSQMLFQATKQHVYFGQINIILPKTWNYKPEYTEIPALSEMGAYITVENGKVKSPHTKRKKKRCGIPGRYIYLHSNFLLTQGKTKWGQHGNVLVHEWGHFRWGLFEEYSTRKNRRFYLDNGEWNPVRCSERVTGQVGKGSSCSRSVSSCLTTDTTKVIDKNCKFCPDENQESSISSMMAFNWVDQVTTFCDKEDDETVPTQQRHNSKAPNKHNSKCKGRSAWEVMRDHSDFNTEPLLANTDTTPIFNVLRETDSYRVFVLDVSGSMGGPRIKTLYQASEYVIQTKIPDDSWLGIVWFSSTASTEMNITQVVSQDVRDKLTAALPQTASGGTCIGCGIDEALKILKDRLSDTAGSEIILISDGEDNGATKLDEAIERAVEANVTIHSISVSQAADVRMITMATATGGIHISYLETGTISFASTFLEILSSGVTNSASAPTTIKSEKIDFMTETTVSFSFDIDSSVGIKTTVSVLQGTPTDISIEVYSPNGTVYTKETTGDSLILDIPGTALTGLYNATVGTQTKSSFEYYVTSYPTSTEVVRIVSWISPVNVDYRTGELPVIEADVMKGRAAVLNADVTVVLETGTSGDLCNVTLLDDGSDPDDTTDDGVYAGVIPRFCVKDSGRISAKVYARGEQGKAAVEDVINGAGSPDIEEDEDNAEVLQDDFQRVTLPNEILIINYDNVIASQDLTAPGRITDVDVIDISTEDTQYGESRNFTITWTATGDDVNIGQALKYELRISDDQNILINNFSAANLLEVVNANYTPKAAGETEFIRLEIDAEESYTSTTFFGIRAIDQEGNAGDVSNIVSILVADGYRITVEGSVNYTYIEEEEVEAPDEEVIPLDENDNVVGLAVGLSLATVFAIVIAVIAITVYRRKLLARQKFNLPTVASISRDQPMKKH